MTFATLKADRSDFGAEEPHLTANVLEEYNESALEPALDIEYLYLAPAKAELLLDLQTQLGLDPSDADDMATIDALIDANQLRLRRALALKQLEIIYRADTQGEGSLNERLYNDYRKKYADAARGFAGLATKRGTATTQTVRISL